MGHLQPTTLVSCHADIARVFDGTDPDALSMFDQTPERLAADAWRDQMRFGKAPTQAFVERLVSEGDRGLLMPSYSRGATVKTASWSFGIGKAR